jgi:hypothetical protein
MKPKALDLCCGVGGWTRGLLETGWDVIGFDVTAFREYPATLYRADVRTVNGSDFGPVQLVVASPPCQEFSRHDQPWTRARNPPPPDLTIWQACERIARECGAPLVVENVRGAQRFMGRSRLNCGAFHLWGDVPALVPHVCYRKKESFGSKQPHLRAVIPPELAVWIGKVFYQRAQI